MTHHLARLPFHLAGPIALVHLCLCSVEVKKTQSRSDSWIRSQPTSEMNQESTPLVFPLNLCCTNSPPGWLPVRASEDWRQISVKPAAAATAAAVVLMQ